MYYQTLKEMIEEIAPNEENMVEGVLLKNMFIERYGGGSSNNMNKALKKLRQYNKVQFEKKGVRIYYWGYK